MQGPDCLPSSKVLWLSSVGGGLGVCASAMGVRLPQACSWSTEALPYERTAMVWALVGIGQLWSQCLVPDVCAALGLL